MKKDMGNKYKVDTKRQSQEITKLKLKLRAEKIGRAELQAKNQAIRNALREMEQSLVEQKNYISELHIRGQILRGIMSKIVNSQIYKGMPMLKGKKKIVKPFYKRKKCTKKNKILRSAKKSSREKDLKRD